MPVPRRTSVPGRTSMEERDPRPRRTSTAGGRALQAAIVLAGTLVLVGAPRIDAQRRVQAADPDHPKLKYADSLVSLNDRCMVRKNKLNPRVRPVYVNRQPVGFC
jgi:hypothetical protein